MNDGLIKDEDGKHRCQWCGTDPLYIDYHDNEWGNLVTSDQRLFEKICLEGFQAGLSWITILKKRDNFRKAFHHFDIDRVAKMTDADIENLLNNAGIIRHRGKIEATINNARCMQDLIADEGAFYSYVQKFKPTSRNELLTYEQLRHITTCDEAIALSKDLKKKGFKFVGPTTCYAFMQAMGMVNDHFKGCDFSEQKAIISN